MTFMRPLVLHPDPLLYRASRELPPPEEWPSVAAELTAAMRHYHGVGLAAVQLGLPLRCFALMMRDGDACLFDPSIVTLSGPTRAVREHCLSIPGVAVVVPRRETLLARWRTAEGQPMERELTGLEARAFQHELDHLNGVLILHHGKPIPVATSDKEA